VKGLARDLGPRGITVNNVQPDRWGHRVTRGILPAALVIAVVLFVAASTPAIAQPAPRFLFPILAAMGAALVVVSFTRSLVRFIRGRRLGAPSPLVPLVMGLVALLLLVVFPLTHLLRALAPARPGVPRILAGFGDWLDSEGYPRTSPHRGLDIAGRPGADVLAAADGRVSVARDDRDLCGLIVVIDHEGGYRTVYCHFSEIGVAVGDRVWRGQRIWATSGQRAWPGFEHVHLELQRGRDVNAIEDPLPWLAGCFEATRAYPTDRLVLTSPVRC
jgi:murein DD-endopeptidase MepM/ murein hydrolase activator NlpD